MKLSDLQYIPATDLPAPHALYRIQRQRARPGSLRLGRLLLPPSDLMCGRFDVRGQPVAYFAETPETAAYEVLCRREALALSMAELGQRNLLCVQTRVPLSLLDLRPHAQSWPVLQSLRFGLTQGLAKQALQYGFSGIVYRSAQQYGMDCYALFGDALKTLKPVWIEPLLEAHSGHLHGVVATALQGSQLPLTP